MSQVAYATGNSGSAAASFILEQSGAKVLPRGYLATYTMGLVCVFSCRRFMKVQTGD